MRHKRPGALSIFCDSVVLTQSRCFTVWKIQTFWPFFSRRGQGGSSGPPQSMPTIPQMAAPQAVPSSFVVTCCWKWSGGIRKYQRQAITLSEFDTLFLWSVGLLQNIYYSIRWMQNLIYIASLSLNFKRIDGWRMCAIFMWLQANATRVLYGGCSLRRFAQHWLSPTWRVRFWEHCKVCDSWSWSSLHRGCWFFLWWY